MTDRLIIWLYAGISEYLALLIELYYYRYMFGSYNATSADNQQGRLGLITQEPSETTRQTSYYERSEVTSLAHIEPSLATLLGLLFTDGCVSPKGNSWRIYFAVKSKGLADIFTASIETSFGLSTGKVRYGMTKDGLHRRVVNSKDLGTFLVNNFGTFRTLAIEGKYPPTKLPVEALIQSKLVAVFLRAAFSCDGGVSLHVGRKQGILKESRWLVRTVFLSCVHPTLRRDYLSLLAYLGVSARDLSKDGKIRIESRNEIMKFYCSVGFLPGVEVTNDSKYWRGMEKQKLLELLITSYSNPSALYNLPKFNV